MTGEFAYSSDLWLDGMLWGATLRSPHPRARLTGLDITGALTLPGVTAVLTHDDVPGSKTYGLEHKDQPVLAVRPGQVPGRTGRAGRGRPPGNGPPGGGQDRRPLRGAAAGDRRPRGPDPRRPGPARGRQPGPARTDPQGSPGHPSGRRGPRRVPGRHAGSGVPRPRIRPGRARRGRRRRPVRGDPVAACGPGSDRGEPRPARRQGAHHAVRRRRGVRRPRRPVHADPRLPARAAHRQARQDGVLPGRVLLRPRAPAPGLAPLRARQHGGRRAGLRQGGHRARRRRVRVELSRRGGQRGDPGHRPLRGASRRDGLLRRLHQQPAVRRDARVRRGPGLLRLRGADGQARRRPAHGSGGAPDQERDAGGVGDADRAGSGLCRPGGRDPEPGQIPPSAARAGLGPRPARPARRSVEHHARRRGRARRRVRGRHQERLLLRGLR